MSERSESPALRNKFKRDEGDKLVKGGLSAKSGKTTKVQWVGPWDGKVQRRFLLYSEVFCRSVEDASMVRVLILCKTVSSRA